VHGISTAAQQGTWRPNLAWLAVAVFAIVASLGTNLGELVYAYILHDPRAIIGRTLGHAVIDDVARMLVCLVGLIILWRAGSRRSCFFLGTGIIAHAAFPFPPVAMPIFRLLIGPLANLMPAFAIAKLQESGIRVSAAARWAVGVSLGASILIWLLDGFFPSLSTPFPEVLTQIRYSASGGLLAELLTVALLGLGWRRAATQEAHRFFILLVAVAVMMVLGNILFELVQSAPGNVYPRWVTDSSALFRITGAFLFAYAILKHRVVDIGFAVNRTLVYGAVTFTLLAAFGLAEFATKRLIPEHGVEASSIVAAATAVLLFLSFHHLHQWFEHQIERLFFHSWHVAEAELKRFVASASQFTSQGALCAAFADELRRYAQGAEVALLLASDGASFRLEAGALAEAEKRYTDEDRAFALMRGERRPIELPRVHSSLPGEVAAPMLDQRGLAGFVLLGPKPDGSHFRPDQEENIGWATHQIGLDLQALKARALDEELARLHARLTAAEAERDRLVSSLIAARSAAEPPPIVISEKVEQPRRK
jgi:hypothetical protein